MSSVLFGSRFTYDQLGSSKSSAMPMISDPVPGTNGRCAHTLRAPTAPIDPTENAHNMCTSEGMSLLHKATMQGNLKILCSLGFS